MWTPLQPSTLPLLSPGRGRGRHGCLHFIGAVPGLLRGKDTRRALSSPKIQGGWGSEFGPLALRRSWEILSVCMVLCDPAYPQGPPPLVFRGDRAALEPAVVALREAGPQMAYTIEQGLRTLRPHFLSATSSFQALRVWGDWLSASSHPFPTSSQSLCFVLLAAVLGKGCQ